MIEAKIQIFLKLKNKVSLDQLKMIRFINNVFEIVIEATKSTVSTAEFNS